jgi:hypothetical protein
MGYNGQWDTIMVYGDGLDLGAAFTSTGAIPVRGADIARRTHQAIARRQCARCVKCEGSKVMGTVEGELLLRRHGRDGCLTFGTVLTVQVLSRFQVTSPTRYYRGRRLPRALGFVAGAQQA